MDILPSLAPRDSHSLWYTSTHNSNNPSHHVEASNHAFDYLAHNNNGQNTNPQSQRRTHQNAAFRSPLARLRLDEEYMERRKLNVQNYGNSWIKPPGVSKSLYQQREEQRERAEQEEAERREEELARNLAAAEAEGAMDDLLQGDGADGEMEEPRDLDDDVPDADADATALDEDEDEDDEDSEEEAENDSTEEVPRGVLAARLPDDVYREAIARGDEIQAARFGDEPGSTIDEEDQAQMLQEEDLVHETGPGPLSMGEDMDMDLDADLDDDIPEAESPGGYEHTDTEEELTSSEEESELPQHGSQRIQGASSMVRSDGTQSSLDLGQRRVHLGSMIERAQEGGSSQTDSSPGHNRGLHGHRGDQ